MSPGSAISALPRAPSPGRPMSLFAGAGGFTQSAVLFPTSIEKNKKTEACSRDPQASSLLHGKGRHRRPFCTKRGETKPLGGGTQAGLGTAKSLRRPAPAMQICREQLAPGEGLVRPGVGGRGRMPGQRSEAGTPPCLGAQANPKLASEAGPHPSLQHFSPRPGASEGHSL